MCANENVKQRLLQGIIIRLTEKARAAVKFRSIQSWDKLKTAIEPQRTTTHLYSELYSSKQKPEEDVMIYSARIESLQTLKHWSKKQTENRWKQPQLWKIALRPRLLKFLSKDSEN